MSIDVFTALAEPTRRSIVEMLVQSGELSATDIYQKFSASPPSISQHLKVLRDANVVVFEKKAQKRIYTINRTALSNIEKWIHKLTEMMEERYMRLDKVLNAEKAKL